ncbi:MAG: hypothetical protein AAFP69_18580, partial [Planctomycetota bacterium]
MVESPKTNADSDANPAREPPANRGDPAVSQEFPRDTPSVPRGNGMSDSPSVADAPARGKGWLRPTLRAIVFALVVAGLAWSVRSAYRGWKTQRGEMQQGVDALNL